MKKTILGLLSTLTLTFAFSLYVHAQTSEGNTSSYDEASSTDTPDSQESILAQIEADLNNLGAYFGYVIKSAPEPTTVNASLYNLKTTITTEYEWVQNVYATLAVNPIYATFIANPLYTNINQLANQVFNNTNSSDNQTASSKTNSLPYTPYPVAQTLQNILSITPDAYCYITRDKCDNPVKKDWNTSCNYKYTQTQFFAAALGLDNNSNAYLSSRMGSGKCDLDTEKPEYMNSLGELLNTNLGEIFFPKTSNLNQKLLPQLDSSLLTSPLLYDTKDSSESSSDQSSDTGSAYQAEFPFGLVSKNNSEAAENYVKYVTGNILPPEPVGKDDLEKIAKNIYQASDIATQLNSFRELSKYMLGLRVYASRISVAIQNIYEILGARKKLPSDNQDENQSTSQALNDFKMASYRLYNPSVNINTLDLSNTQQPSTWQQMINDASPARVQKETAILLAEINYQLYLMRKQQEKLLLTNSVMLLQSASAPSLTVPNPDDTGAE